MKKVLKTIFFLVIAIILFSGCETQQPMQDEGAMMCFGSLIKLRPVYEERYIILHAHTFPGVLDRIYKSNIRNFSIFLRDGILFSFMDYIGDDYGADMAKIAEDPVTQDWWKLTDPMQEPFEDRKEGEWWFSMEEIFYHGKKMIPSPDARRYGYVTTIKPGSLDAVKNNFNNLLPNVREELIRANIQNISMYNKDTRLYVYIEYSGRDYATDMRKWQEELGPVLKPYFAESVSETWGEMKEVFHTN